jgi:DNA-binding MurR/RpiR family transcriptional regulator
MSYEDRIRENRSRMSKSFARLAEYILDSYIEVAMMTATELAHQVDVDAATVVRFAQMLGYSGFPELHREVKNRVRLELLVRPKDEVELNSVAGVVEAALGRLTKALEQTSLLLDTDTVEQLVGRIGEARRVVLLPESLGQAAAYNLAALLEQGGFLVTTAQQSITDMARVVSTAQQDDILIAIDVAGEAPYIARTLSEARARGVGTAAIAGAASLESVQAAEIALAAQSQPDIGTGIVVVDAVVYILAEALRWQYPERFRDTGAVIEDIFVRIQVGER